MDKNTYISIKKVCELYHIPESFFEEIKEFDILDEDIFDKNFERINTEYLTDLEKIMRLRYDLNINMEGIDVINNLLRRIHSLEEELDLLKRKLGLYLSE